VREAEKNWNRSHAVGRVFIRSDESDGISRASEEGPAVGTESEKRIILRIDPNDEMITLKDIMQKIQEIQRQHPDLDVFFDGDEYAVCSRPKQPARAIAEAVEGKKKA
jgi:hypothetical protein